MQEKTKGLIIMHYRVVHSSRKQIKHDRKKLLKSVVHNGNEIQTFNL